MALLRGMQAVTEQGKVVTVDITNESDNYLTDDLHKGRIVKLVGNANEFETVTRVLETIDDVDILFIDAAHTAAATLVCFSIYTSLLKPKIVVLDDITLSSDMQRFWNLIRSRFPFTSVNAAAIERGIRDAPGFGVVCFTNPSDSIVASHEQR